MRGEKRRELLYVGALALGVVAVAAVATSEDQERLGAIARSAALVAATSTWTRSWRAFLVTGAAFVVSLAFRGALVPFAVIATVAPLVAPRDERLARVASLVAAVVLAIGVGSEVARVRMAPPALRSADPREVALAERARHNPYRARAAALVWSRTEEPPGEAYLTLAEIDWDLGLGDKARKVLDKVLTRGTDPALVDRARATKARWDASP